MAKVESPVDWEQYGKERILTRNRLLLGHHRVVTDLILDWFAREDLGQAFLEVGCGDGFWLDLFRNLGFRHVKGLDISRHFVEVSRAKGHDVEHCSLEEYEPNILFDWVYAMDVLEHLDDPRAMLGRMLKFLRPGGKILLKVPVYDSLARRTERMLRQVSKLTQAMNQDPTHVHAFSAGEIKRLLESSGCRVVRSAHTSNAWPFSRRLPAAWDATIQRISFRGLLGDAFLIIGEKHGDGSDTLCSGRC